MEEKLKREKIEELIKIANTPEEELSKMSFKEKQKVFSAKNKLCKVFYRGGTYVNRKNRNT